MRSFKRSAKLAPKRKSNWVGWACLLLASLFFVGSCTVGVGYIAVSVTTPGVTVSEPGFRVLILEDFDKRLSLTEEQKDFITSNADDSLKRFVHSINKDGLRIESFKETFEKDTPGFREMYNLWDKKTLPWIVIVNNRKAFTGPLDANSFDKVKSYAPKKEIE